MTDACAQRSIAPEFDLSNEDRERLSDRSAFVCLAVLFVAVSLFSWTQPVSSMEMNRNDAACYLILGKNLVQHGVYSLDQSAPFRPHTEWPPGIPLLYALPTIFLDFPLTAAGTSLIHAWTLLISLTSLWLVYRFLRTLIPQFGALAVVATLATTKAFLDSAQAAVADTASVGVAFLALHAMQRYFAAQTPAHDQCGVLESQHSPSNSTTRRRQVAMHVALALAPLVKPYLGMLHAAYLAKLCQRWWNERTTGAGNRRHVRFIKGIVTLGICCIPFAGFIGYSVIYAAQSEQISAITWLTTDNPAAIQSDGQAVDHKSLQEWISSGLGVLKYHLVYNITDAVLPALSWCGFSDWPATWRGPVLVAVLGTVLVGTIRLLRRGEVLSVAYSIAMFAFFIVFACDSPRYFTVLSPMCGLFAWSGATAILEQCRRIYSTRLAVTGGDDSVAWSATSARLATVALLSGAAVSSGFWISHRCGHRFDAVPFYEELYTVLHAARDNESVHVVVVPFQLRDVSIVETGKPVFTWKDYAENRDALPHSIAILTLKDDPTGRIRQAAPAIAYEANTAAHPELKELKFIELRTTAAAKLDRALVRRQQ